MSMSLVDLLLLLLVAGIAGAMGKAVGGMSGGGCLLSVGLGFLGALLGTWLARLLDLPAIFTISVGGTAFPVVWAIVGAALLVVALGFVRRQRWA